MWSKTVFVLLTLSFLFPAVLSAEGDVCGTLEDHLQCDEGESCYNFEGERFCSSDPCSYCPNGTECHIAESYPAQISCMCVGPECPAERGRGNPEDTVEYDVLTGEERIIPASESSSSQTEGYTPGFTGIFEAEDVSAAFYGEAVQEGEQLYLQGKEEKLPVNIFPKKAVELSGLSEAASIELREVNGTAEYRVAGAKRARLLFLIPVEFEVETKILANTGKVESVKKPFWSFLAFG